jgi:hypothetical protein
MIPAGLERFLKLWDGRLGALLIGVVLSFVLFAIADVTVGVLVKTGPTLAWKSSRAKMFFVPDSILGYRAPREALQIEAQRIS